MRWSRRFARGATPSAIDIPVSSAYLSSMFARVVSMLAIAAVAVMTMVFSAHAASMGIAPDQAVHVSETWMREPVNWFVQVFQSFSYHRAVVLETNTRQPPMSCRLMPALPVGRLD